MDAPLPATTLLCAQCGGKLHPDEGQVFLTCPASFKPVVLPVEDVDATVEFIVMDVEAGRRDMLKNVQFSL